VWFVDAAATGSATERLQVSGEVISAVGANRADDKVFVRLGLAYAFTEDVHRLRGTQGIVTILSLAFGLGLVHALDADHVMAVTGLASHCPDRRRSLTLSVRWAIGHGLSLLAVGTAVLLLGRAIPQALSALAEGAVGLVLIGIGLGLLWDLAHRRVHLHFHRHDGLPPHAHLHAHGRRTSRWAHQRDPHAHHHSAVLVGVLHGCAGSAPLLALLPLSQLGSPWLGLAYLFMFGLGTLVAMVVFGGVLGGLMAWLMHRGDRVIRSLRTAVAVSSIALGMDLLYLSL
jgi:ABC-type uncharacterized transport system, permease component